jgi:hypothetical protein
MKKRGVIKMPVVITLEYGALAIEAGLDFNFAVVFL